MKRNFFASVVAAIMALVVSSCATIGNSPIAQGTSTPATATNTSSTQQTAESVLGSLLGSLIGNAIPVNENNIVGTWIYSSPEVRFESEDFLSKAGGEVAAASIEKKLEEIYAKIGVVPGTSGFVFNADKTCSIALGTKALNGTYTLDPKTNSIQITAGLIKLNGKVYFGLNSLVILFDADKILTVAQALAAFTGQGNSSIGVLSGALSQYKGLMLGMNLSKQK